MPKPTTWVVTTTGNCPLETVAAELRHLGFTSLQVLDAIGCITGAAPRAAAAAARRLPGVVDVAADPELDLGPPSGDPTG
jgi:hypothetical protein